MRFKPSSSEYGGVKPEDIAALELIVVSAQNF
jgi:hypothetical protein